MLRQHIQCTLDVVGAVEQRHLNAAGYGAPRRLIKDIIHALTGFHTGVQILDIALDEFIIRIIKEHIDIRLLAR